MYLKELIELLEKQDPNIRAAVGFGKPHSYRGYYEQLAFEPVKNTTAGEMLESAQSAVGKTFLGWKGGSYEMDEWSPCWLAWEGSSSEEPLSRMTVEAMLGLPLTFPEER